MTDPGKATIPNEISVDELRSVIDDIAAKAGETPEQRRRRQVAEEVRSLVAAGMTSSKPLRALVRAKITAEDESRGLRQVVAHLQATNKRQEIALSKLADITRELSQQNKNIRDHSDAQFAAHDSKQQKLRDAFNSSVAEIEERIKTSSAEKLAAQQSHQELKSQLRKAHALEKDLRKHHEQQMALKDREIAKAEESILAAHDDFRRQEKRATLAEAKLESYETHFDEMQITIKDDARTINDLKKQAQATGRRNKSVQKENNRLEARLSTKEEELVSVKTQFEKFLRRSVVSSDKAISDPPNAASSSSPS